MVCNFILVFLSSLLQVPKSIVLAALFTDFTRRRVLPEEVSTLTTKTTTIKRFTKEKTKDEYCMQTLGALCSSLNTTKKSLYINSYVILAELQAQDKNYLHIWELNKEADKAAKQAINMP